MLLLVAPVVAGAVQEVALRGIVVDATGLPLAGVSVYIQGDEAVVLTDADGRFKLHSAHRGRQLVVAFLSGFWPTEMDLLVDGVPRDLKLVLQLANLEESVSVVAPALEEPIPSQRRLDFLDVVRTPGAQADTFRALQDLAGVTQIDDGAELFVRGGDSSEVLTLLDGAVIYHPYRYETATGSMFGAVEPFLIEQLSFSSGGFPARFGNTMSAVLDMRGLDRPAASETSATLGLAGASGRVAFPLGTRAGIRASGNRTLTRALFALNRSPRAFTHYPSGWDVNASGYYDSSALGSFKFFGMSQRDRVGVELEADAFDGFLESGARNELVTTRWEKSFADGWRAVGTFGNSRYVRHTQAGALDLDIGEGRRSWRADLTGAGKGWVVRLGTDGARARTTAIGRIPTRGNDFGGRQGTSLFDVRLDEWHVGTYAEIERRSEVLVPNLGVRIDRFQQTQSVTVDPRLSLLINVGGKQRLRVAWGAYHQAPSALYYDSYRGAEALLPMRAYHWVGGYEYGSSDDAFHLRTEAYLKRYQNLPLQHGIRGFSSEGFGSARGVDVSVRGSWSVLDFQVDYASQDPRRRWTPADQYNRYEIPDGTWTPDFSVPHAFRATTTLALTDVTTLAASWRVASGRPYTPVLAARPDEVGGYAPTFGAINTERVPRYERLDVTWTLLTLLRGASGIVFIGVTNVLGRHNVFRYAYSSDYSERRPVTSALPRAVYIGMSVIR